jgi:hypothetical protein
MRISFKETGTGFFSEIEHHLYFFATFFKAKYITEVFHQKDASAIGLEQIFA